MKKYSTDYSRLSKIILDMSDEQRAAMLILAEKILVGKKSTESPLKNINKYWFVAIGILFGWIIAISIIITSSKII